MNLKDAITNAMIEYVQGVEATVVCLRDECTYGEFEACVLSNQERAKKIDQLLQQIPDDIEIQGASDVQS